MNFLRFLFSRSMVVNLAIAVLLFFCLAYCGFKKLNSYTEHNQYVEVPDFTGFSVSELDEAVSSKNLRYFLLDSIHDNKIKKGTVVKQDPSVGEMVKSNRTIYITINAFGSQQTTMPSLLHASYRLAATQLKARGLKVGNITHIPNIAKNAVLKVHVKGKEIRAGQKVDKGTVIDLVLGEGENGEKTMVPMLLGRTYQEAEERLKMEGLSLGYIKVEEGVTDTANAIVQSQIPAEGKEINMGASVSLILVKEFEVKPADSIQ